MCIYIPNSVILFVGDALFYKYMLRGSFRKSCFLRKQLNLKSDKSESILCKIYSNERFTTIYIEYNATSSGSDGEKDKGIKESIVG